jgi:galactose oxidase
MMQFLSKAAVLAAAASTASAAAIAPRQAANDLPPGTFIAHCPGSEFSLTNGNGTEFLGCPGTWYQGPTAGVVNGTTLEECEAICMTNCDCQKAAWNSVTGQCDVKAPEPQNTLFWVTNSNVTSITRRHVPVPAVQGLWGPVLRIDIIPIAGYVVPEFPQSERVLFFSAFGTNSFGGTAGYTQYVDYNFVTGEASHRNVTETNHDMFCPGISALEDGRILINGGSNAEVVSFYDPVTNEFTRGPDMRVPRGYQTSATMSDGKVFVIGGSFYGGLGGKDGEVWDPRTNEWTLLPGAAVIPLLTDDHEGMWRQDSHAWLMGWKNNSVIQAGPSMKQHWYGIEGEGSVNLAGVRDFEHAMCAVYVMYDAVEGKMFSAGGAPDYNGTMANTRAHITTLGEPFEPVTNERVPDMALPRVFANAVVTPNGKIIVTGGQRVSMIFTNFAAVYPTEMFDPETNTWTMLSSEGIPRTYHSISILLADGTVYSGGGGGCPTGGPGRPDFMCGDRNFDHPDGQIFYPPYLFNEDGTKAVRPQITSLGAQEYSAGDVIDFTVAGEDVSQFSLIRIGSVTHSINSDQRRVPLNDIERNGDQIHARLPSDYGVLLPGHYYLFAMTSSGTPSIARTVKIVF